MKTRPTTQLQDELKLNTNSGGLNDSHKMYMPTNDNTSALKDPSSPLYKYTESYTMSLRSRSITPSGPAVFGHNGYNEEPMSPSRMKLGCYAQNQRVEPPPRQMYGVMQNHALHLRNKTWTDTNKLCETIPAKQGFRPVLQPIANSGKKQPVRYFEHKRHSYFGPMKANRDIHDFQF